MGCDRNCKQATVVLAARSNGRPKQSNEVIMHRRNSMNERAYEGSVSKKKKMLETLYK